MTNKELMNFKFVNRTEARKDANSYLHNKQKAILAVFGKNKAGKDYFIDQLEKENKDLTFIVFDFNEISSNPIKYIINRLYIYNNSSFMRFIKENYKKIIKSSAILIDSFARTKFSEIYDCLNDKECTFVNIDQYHESPISFICKYIKEIAQNREVVITFKNITSCEKIYIRDLFEIIATIYEFKEIHVRFIISFNEDIYNNDVIFNEYLNRFQYVPINIKKFDDSKFFLEILKDIFDITAKNKNYLEHLFNICDGYPGELKSILKKAYKISYKSFEGMSNLYFDESLIEKAVNINTKNDLTALEKIILTVVLFVDFDFTYEQLVAIISYILAKLHSDGFKTIIEETLQALLFEKQLLEYKLFPEDGLQYIKFDSNSNCELYMSICQNNKIFPQLSYYIFLFINEHREFSHNMDKFNANRAFFSWKAQTIDWKKLIIMLGNIFLIKMNYHYQKIFFCG